MDCVQEILIQKQTNKLVLTVYRKLVQRYFKHLYSFSLALTSCYLFNVVCTYGARGITCLWKACPSLEEELCLIPRIHSEQFPTAYNSSSSGCFPSNLQSHLYSHKYPYADSRAYTLGAHVAPTQIPIFPNWTSTEVQGITRCSLHLYYE